jgi:inner membrane protein
MEGDMSEFWPVIGAWAWWIVAGLLLIGELLMPGIFLLWLGVAAAATGVLDLIFDFGWKAELVAFALLSALSVFLSWKYKLGMGQGETDSPHLNNPMQAMIGKRYTLVEPMANGRGRLQIDDTLWDIEGPDLGAGETVRITSINGLKLVVERADRPALYPT